MKFGKSKIRATPANISGFCRQNHSNSLMIQLPDHSFIMMNSGLCSIYKSQSCLVIKKRPIICQHHACIRQTKGTSSNWVFIARWENLFVTKQDTKKEYKTNIH